MSSHVTEEQIQYAPSLCLQDIAALLSLEGWSPTFKSKEMCYRKKQGETCKQLESHLEDPVCRCPYH